MAMDDEATSKLRAWRTAAHRNGTDTELLTIAGSPSKLFVLCGNRFETSRGFRTGDLSVRIIRMKGSPVSMTTCMVGDHQWMLAKDSMVLRAGDRSFVFALPGLLYGLELPVGCSDQQCRSLEDVFKSYCAYQDLMDNNNQGSEPDSPNPGTDTWALAYSKILNLATRNSTKIAAPDTTAPASAGFDVTSKKIQRAVRMSAAVKLVSRAILSGALHPADHLHVSVEQLLPGTTLRAYPTMWAIADLLDAIEVGAPPERLRRAPPPQGFWGFRQEGLAVLLGVVKAYGGIAEAAPARKRARINEEAAEEGEKSTVRSCRNC